MPKIKAAIEGVTFMAWSIQRRDKELQTLWKELEDQRVAYMLDERKKCLKKKLQAHENSDPSGWPQVLTNWENNTQEL